MFTCREHIEEFRKTGKLPNPLWVHGLDALAHVLKGDVHDTFYQDKSPNVDMLRELQSYLDGKPKEVDKFLEAKHNAFVQERRWKRFDSEMGDLQVDRYLDGEPRPFDDYKKMVFNKPSVSILMDMSVPFREREGDEVRQRHEAIYRYACLANKEGRPCQVVAVEKCDIDEARGFRTCIVLKDYDDPIFPAIWAAFENNRLTNSFMNAFMDYFVGTHDWGNGSVKHYNIDEDFPGEIILIEPKTWVTTERRSP